MVSLWLTIGFAKSPHITDFQKSLQCGPYVNYVITKHPLYIQFTTLVCIDMKTRARVLHTVNSIVVT